MADGKREVMHLAIEERDEREKLHWWRNAILCAEIHNGLLGILQAWGGGKDRQAKSPKQCDPTGTFPDGGQAVETADEMDDSDWAIHEELARRRRDGI